MYQQPPASTEEQQRADPELAPIIEYHQTGTLVGPGDDLGYEARIHVFAQGSYKFMMTYLDTFQCRANI